MLEMGSRGSGKASPPQTEFAITLVVAVLFIDFFVLAEDPYSLGGSFLVAIAYVAAVVISLYHLRNLRAVTPFVVATLVVLALAWVIGGSGFPVGSATVSYTTTCTSYTNVTSGLVQSICGQQPHPGQDYPLAIAENFAVWAPLVGCILYTVPENGRLLGYVNLGKMIRGAIPAAVLMFPLLGVRSTDGFRSPVVGIGPIDPNVAFRECDSTTATSGCVFTNPSYLLADFIFWLATAMLVAVIIGEVYQAQSKRGQRKLEGRDPRAKWVAVFLAVLMIAGLTVVPPVLTQGGAIITSGSIFPFNSNDFIEIPFNSTHPSQLAGSFTSSVPVDVYLLNSAQFNSYDLSGNWFCPIAGISPLLSNVTQGKLDARTFTGSNQLVFCISFAYYPVGRITVQITSSIRIRE
ncbi:MAG: hypothetical protein OK452_10045 [Thaumarchaeota archaeon]|nr:hypothetical protein [Nitrososphaerota archaeon]